MLDLEATWNVNKILQIRAGANNVLDKNPPLVDSVLVGGGVANTYSLYDMFGRPNPRRRILPGVASGLFQDPRPSMIAGLGRRGEIRLREPPGANNRLILIVYNQCITMYI